jgi:ribonuclease Z
VVIDGLSIAGHESYYRLPRFRASLEIGRCPDDLVGVSHVFLTHAHLDHAAGLAYYASQRCLASLSGGDVWVPAKAWDGIDVWLRASEALENVRYAISVHRAIPGDLVSLRRDLDVKIFAGRHRVPTVGYLFTEVRHKLVDRLRGETSAGIAARRARGEEVTRREEIPLLAFPGDCGPAIFDAAPEIFGCRVLLLECSFLAPEDRERAHRYEHLHVDDIADRADDFDNEAIVLTHFSMRYTAEEIRSFLEARLPKKLKSRVVPFLGS